MYKYDSCGPLANVSLTTTIGDIYTVPSGKLAQITEILIVNTAGTAEDFELWVTTQDDTHIFLPRTSLAIGARKILRTPMLLTGSSVIKGKTFINGGYTSVYCNVHGLVLVN